MHLVRGTLRPLCTPVFLIYAQRYCTIYMALRPPELESSFWPPSIPSEDSGWTSSVYRRLKAYPPIAMLQLFGAEEAGCALAICPLSLKD